MRWLLLVLCACGPSAAARGVRLYNEVRQVSGCDDLGLVKGHATGWGDRFRADAELAAREEAAKMGADAMMVRSHSANIFGHNIVAEAYRCKSDGKRAPFLANASAERMTVTLAKPTRVLVLQLRVIDGDQRLAEVFTNLVTAELQKVKNCNVIDRGDIDAALNLEKQKDLVGCDDTQCLSEIADALGATLVVHGSIGTIGSNYAVNASLFDSRAAKARARFSRTVARHEDNLLQLIPELSLALARGMND